MAGIGLRAQHRGATPFVPAPDERGIALEGVRGCELGAVITFPETGLFVAEGGDAALRGNAGAGEDGDAGRGAQGVCDLGESIAGMRAHSDIWILLGNLAGSRKENGELLTRCSTLLGSSQLLIGEEHKESPRIRVLGMLNIVGWVTCQGASWWLECRGLSRGLMAIWANCVAAH